MATAAPSRPSVHPGHGEFHCPRCGHLLRTAGDGRHRIFFEPNGDGAGAGEVILNRGCPECGLGLPGKGTPWVRPAGTDH
jgi:predicted RNA-binding Zn-ribbon protein involved in translation (DUF1610 family)